MNSKIAIDTLRQFIYKYIHDYEIVDVMEEYLREIENYIEDLERTKDGNKISME